MATLEALQPGVEAALLLVQKTVEQGDGGPELPVWAVASKVPCCENHAPRQPQSPSWSNPDHTPARNVAVMF